ncbi:MgtC/SapB family protein [Pseudomonas sp. F1_0610]|uniref:MgtC/SapB family protein n=1 Tax=Pseudomonas sp. F1_0610 TaxID=3114284 RepID=UPI0039C3A297
MDWKIFLLRVGVAMLLGAVIGVERQLRHRLAGLRTNALVASGACLFVMVSAYTGDFSSAGRIAGQVVSGIGFLGAGVIMREGFNVRGLNTAATLWCSAAIGVLCGLGLLIEASLGMLVILCANILLREAAQRINKIEVVNSDQEQHYRVKIVCHADDEVHVRTLLLHSLGNTGYALQSLLSEDIEGKSNSLCVMAELISKAGGQSQLEQIVSRISLERSVSSVSWKLIAETEEEI